MIQTEGGPLVRYQSTKNRAGSVTGERRKEGSCGLEYSFHLWGAREQATPLYSKGRYVSKKPKVMHYNMSGV